MKDSKEALRPYVADMVAVEKHILEAVERQRNDDDIKQFPDALQLVGRLESVLKSHVQALESHAQSFPGGGAASTVKQAVTGVLGAIAGIYDKVRKDTASRALRDDYTALSLASVSYGMLHTTALGLSQGTTAELAKSNLEEINSLIMELGLTLPRIVLKELAFEGYSVDTSAADRAVKNLEETWRSSAQREKAGVASTLGGSTPTGSSTGGSFNR
jgi:ferritin-like metal-binding protein YciE